MQVTIRVRMSAHDAHYGGNLVDGAKMLELFGDVATELLIRRDGDEGLFCAFSMACESIELSRASLSSIPSLSTMPAILSEPNRRMSLSSSEI